MPVNTKKVFLIHHYEALFNDEQMTCGLTINLDEFEVPVYNFVEPEPTFNVDVKNKKIIVEGNKEVMEFLNCDDELILRALKTNILTILFGRSETLEVEGAIIANPLI